MHFQQYILSPADGAEGFCGQQLDAGCFVNNSLAVKRIGGVFVITSSSSLLSSCCGGHRHHCPFCCRRPRCCHHCCRRRCCCRHRCCRLPHCRIEQKLWRHCCLKLNWKAFHNLDAIRLLRRSQRHRLSCRRTKHWWCNTNNLTLHFAESTPSEYTLKFLSTGALPALGAACSGITFTGILPPDWGHLFKPWNEPRL